MISQYITFSCVYQDFFSFFKIRYSANAGQLRFLQALTKIATQRLEYSCIKSTSNARLENVIKIRGINGRELPRESRLPRLDIRANCKVRLVNIVHVFICLICFCV